MKVKSFFMLFFVYLGLNTALADQRFYVWTYEYKTVGRAQAEIEFYHTLFTPDLGKIKGNMGYEHQIELEIGKGDKADFSIYQILAQNPGEGIKYKGFKLRGRYKIGNKGKYFFDPLIYFEYKGAPDFSKHGIESKLILAKDIGKINIALNPILELEHDEEWEFLPAYAMGISYEISAWLRVGLEANGREDLWVALGSALKIGKIKEGKPEFQIRLLLGIGL